MVKVTFIAKETGFYKIIFSNEHSWYRPKTLKFRYVVLRPYQTQVPAISERQEPSYAEIDDKEEEVKKQLEVKVADETHEEQVEAATQEALIEVDEARVHLEENKKEETVDVPELEIDFPSHVITHLSNADEEAESDKIILVDAEEFTLYFGDQLHSDFQGESMFVYFEKYCLDYLMIL